MDYKLPQLPEMVAVYVNADGSVTFADLSASMLPVVAALDPSLFETPEEKTDDNHNDKD